MACPQIQLISNNLRSHAIGRLGSRLPLSRFLFRKPVSVTEEAMTSPRSIAQTSMVGHLKSLTHALVA
jgi:hypothetical protein